MNELTAAIIDIMVINGPNMFHAEHVAASLPSRP